MENKTIKSDSLEVSFRLPGEGPLNTRFDAAAVIDRVMLGGKHSFCVPEQILPGRVTTGGTGLCCEFVWGSIAEEAAAGEYFPKLGVGLLKQVEDHSAHRFSRAYEADPFETNYEFFPDRVIFTQEPKPCLGVAARVLREVRVSGNRLTQHTTLHNVGERLIDLYEYNHNFISIDNLPVGPGYRLEFPWHLDIEDVKNHIRQRGAQPERLDGVIGTRGQSVVWQKPQPEGAVLHFDLGADKIAVLPRYYWKLTHDASPASITETVSYAPCRVVVWCIEHCLSTEMYCPITAKPGQAVAWTREWVFEG